MLKTICGHINLFLYLFNLLIFLFFDISLWIYLLLASSLTLTTYYLKRFFLFDFLLYWCLFNTVSFLKNCFEVESLVKNSFFVITFVTSRVLSSLRPNLLDILLLLFDLFFNTLFLLFFIILIEFKFFSVFIQLFFNCICDLILFLDLFFCFLSDILNVYWPWTPFWVVGCSIHFVNAIQGNGYVLFDKRLALNFSKFILTSV